MTPLYELAPAKVNLDLHVLGRRTDGRHDLDSIAVFTELGDELSFEPASEFNLVLEGPFAEGLEGGPDNLVLRAAHALADAAGIEAGARIGLTKRLPVAAGIGGGSADAAATLRGLSRFWQLDLPPERLQAIALALGADVPVCLQSRPARMLGLGEQLTGITLPALPILLVNPGIPTLTGPVFAGRRPDEGGPRRQDLPPPTGPAECVRWLQGGRNDLAGAARRLVPVIEMVEEEIAAQPGCALARMSGSGATCFGLFPTPRAASAAALRLATRHPEWWVQATRMLAG